MAEMVPDEVEAAERIGGFAHGPFGLGVLAQVGNDALGLASGRRDLANDGLDALLVDVDDRDSRALLSKSQRPGAAHARPRRGHDPNLVLEPHVPSPSMAAAI